MQTAPNKIEHEYTLRNYETDFSQRLKPSAALGFFQETAGEHATRMGLGFDELRQQGYYWVLSKIFVRVDRRPAFRDTVRVETWPHTPNKAIYERSFRMSDSLSGEVLLRAYSRWCILQAPSGRIVPCARLVQNIPQFIEERSVSFDEWQIPALEQKTTPAYSMRVANSDYDLNYHLNNIKYADYIFDVFSVRELEERTLRSFQIHYVKQSHEGDVLDFYRGQMPDGSFVVEGVKNGGELVVAARVCFD